MSTRRIVATALGVGIAASALATGTAQPAAADTGDSYCTVKASSTAIRQNPSPNSPVVQMRSREQRIRTPRWVANNNDSDTWWVAVYTGAAKGGFGWIRASSLVHNAKACGTGLKDGTTDDTLQDPQVQWSTAAVREDPSPGSVNRWTVHSPRELDATTWEAHNLDQDKWWRAVNTSSARDGVGWVRTDALCMCGGKEPDQ